GPASTVATLLELLTLVVFAAAAAWWLLRAKAIRGGRLDLADASVSRDLIFAVVLLLVVTSRVLSSPYMVWLLGLSAVVLSAGTPPSPPPRLAGPRRDRPHHQHLRPPREPPDPQPRPARSRNRRLDRDGDPTAATVSTDHSRIGDSRFGKET